MPRIPIEGQDLKLDKSSFSLTPESQSTKRLYNKIAKQMILDEGSYTPVPNKLRSAWRKGIISRGCYDLVCECLEHSETFWLRDDYLLKIFGNNRSSLLKARKEAATRNLIKVHKIRFKKSFVNHYELLPPNQWELSTEQNCSVENDNSSESSTEQISTVQISTVQICTHLTRQTSNKKKLNNKNGGGAARAHAYDQTNELEEKDAPPPPLSRSSSQPKEEAKIISLSKRLERFYVTKKGNPSAYDWAEANEASRRLYERGDSYVEMFIKFLDENYRRGKFFVSRDMWSEVHSEIENQKFKTIEDTCTDDIDIEELKRKMGGSLDDIPF